MESKDLTPQQRIMILEDVLKKLEDLDDRGGLCVKIKNSAFKLFCIMDKAKNIIPNLTFENAKKVTDVVDIDGEGGYWWKKISSCDFENRIKFVKWMIEQERWQMEQHLQNEQWENNMSNLYTYSEDGFCDGFTNW